VASDSTRSLFYHNNGNGTFSERGIYTGMAYDEDGGEQGGMGVALGDFDRDGLPDIVKTNFSDDYPNLYRNLGKVGFEDCALRAGLGVNPQYVLWGAALADFDNDGWQDLFLAAGQVFPEVDRIHSMESFRCPRLLYWNLGNGSFEDVSDRAGSGIAALHSSRGVAVGDFDRDGNLDVLVMNMNEPPSLLRNINRSGNHWVELKLVGTKSNRSAIGAKARLSAGGQQQTGFVLSESSYYSHSDSRLHFGLGKSTAVDSVQVTWPSGAVEKFSGLTSDRVAVLRRATVCSRTGLLLLIAVSFAAAQPVNSGELRRGLQLFSESHFADAEPLLRKAVAEQPRSFEARLALGATLAELKRTADAIEQLRAAHRLNPAHVDAMKLLAAQYIADRKYADAVALLAPVRAPDEELYLLLIESYQSSGDTAKSFATAQEAVRHFPSSPQINCWMGFQLQFSGRFGDAHAYLEQAIRLAPDYPVTYYILADVLLKQQKTRQSIPYFEKAIELDPDDTEARLGLSQAWTDAGALDKALAVLLGAEKRSPENARVHLLLSRIWFREWETKVARNRKRSSL
jgi:tetratricopeptide (TPR) repeat protein